MPRCYTKLEHAAFYLAAILCIVGAVLAFQLFPQLTVAILIYMIGLCVAYYFSGVVPLELRSLTAQTNSRKTLVVICHAYTMTPQDMNGVIEIVKTHLTPEPDYICPVLPVYRFSHAKPNDMVLRLLSRISEIVGREEDHKYAEIIFVGHSVGALVARKVYVCACSEIGVIGSTFAPFEEELQEDIRRGASTNSYWWAKHVTRIILFAGMNRGWSISHHLSMKLALAFTFMQTVGRPLNLPWWPLIIYSFRRGSPWVTNLRIQWLAMRRRAQQITQQGATTGPVAGSATTIQLLGSRDDYVSPDDNIDLVSGGDFIYLDVPHSGHKSVIKMGPGQRNEAEQNKADNRAKVFKVALLEAPERIRTSLPADRIDFLPPTQEEIRNVIFVMHGIRDAGYWTHKLARRIKAKYEPNTVETKTSTYGYFPMWPFLLPWKRDEKVEWLMDQYAECLAIYPNADFSYVGHSNGTYLLAAALRKYSCVRFKRVVFAGSVVQRGYDWAPYFATNRVGAVLNYVATADWVVAWFPKAFQWLSLQSLGSAGHNGFSARYVDWKVFFTNFRQWKNAKLPDKLEQFRYVQGGHSAALVEEQWDNIAGFIVDGTVPTRNNHVPWWKFPRGFAGSMIAAVGFMPIVIWFVLLAALVYGGLHIVRLDWAGWEKLLVGVYALGIWKILNKL